MGQGSDLRRATVLRVLTKPVCLALLVGLLFCVSMFGITGWRLLRAYDLELAETRVTTANLARSAADHASGTIRDASIVLAGLVEWLQVDGASGPPLDRIHATLVRRVATIPTIHHLVVFSANGDALTASFEPMPPVNVADRAYFAYHRDHPSAGELVGPAVRNRADGHWSVTVSRRFERPGGGFGGVVVAILDCDTFTSFYASLNVGAHGSITLVHDDHTFVVRYPEPPDPAYRSVPLMQDYWARAAGNGRVISPLDGVARQFSFQKADGVPLTAIVALSEADVFTDWHRDAWLALTVCSGVFGLLGLLGWGLVRQIRRSEQREVALERSEQRYRMLAEHSTDVIIQLGPDMRREYVSPACERLFGYRPDEMLHGHPRDLTHPEDWPALQAMMGEILRTGRAAPITHRTSGRDGRYFWVETLGQKLDGGRGLIVTLREATHRKEAERRLLEETAAREAAQVQLAHTQRLETLGQLAGGIAHDFNNVLQAVQGGARLIARSPGDADGVRRIARMVTEAADRGASVTKRLLAFSRRGELRAEPVDPANLLAGLLELFEHTLGGGIEVLVETGCLLPPLVADKGQLETVLVNLATNARDAMPDGGVLILAADVHVTDDQGVASRAGPSCPPALQPGQYIRVTVTDNGSGIAPEVLARVAEPFFTTKPQGKGTGLGLAMAKGFAEQSGGAFTIESTLGRGTTVALWFPTSADRAFAVKLSGEGTGPTPLARSGRILVVDDDRLVREIVAEQLIEGGYDVLVAGSGPAALNVLDSGERIDLMISDYSMPGMDGVTVIREAQRRRSGMPAILLTGFAPGAAKLDADDALSGRFTLLRKPVETGALVDCVSTLLETAMAVAEG